MSCSLAQCSQEHCRQGYELMKQPYPTMKDLANGFKLIFANMSNSAM